MFYCSKKKALSPVWVGIAFLKSLSSTFVLQELQKRSAEKGLGKGGSVFAEAPTRQGGLAARYSCELLRSRRFGFFPAPTPLPYSKKPEKSFAMEPLCQQVKRSLVPSWLPPAP